MKSIKGQQLPNLSFPDFEVIDLFLDIPNQCLEIYLDGAIFDAGGNIEVLKKGRLRLESWNSISISAYFSDEDVWKEVALSKAEKLKDICEVNFGETVILRGFSKDSGLWIEYKLDRPYVIYAET